MPTLGSLFSGIEGFGLGFERAGFQIKWQVEQDAFCNAILKTHWPAAKPTIAPTLSTKNEVASSSSSSRQKWMEQCSEMLMTVRRLTPTECETLQAFPKGWTLPATEHWGTRSRRVSPNGSRKE